MAQLKYCDKHNQVGFLRKPDESTGFAEIVDFLRGSNLRTLEINATIDTIWYTITEASIRDTLQLADATGITMLPNDEIFEGMGQIGYPTDGTFTFWKSQEHHVVAQSQPSSSTLPVPSTSSPPVQSSAPIPASIPTPTPIPETEPKPFEHTFEEPSPVHQHFSPLQE
ncbi:hypothetical protein Tco_0373380 [Tanacetum coccineum]